MRGNVMEELVLSGEIDATEYASLTYETSGRIIYVGAKEGDVVKKGQILGRLDSTTLNSAYQSSLATLRAADANVDQIHDDVKDHDDDESWTIRNTRTTAEATKDKAYEAMLIAERNLKGATIYAPFEGIITNVTNPYPNIFTLLSQSQFDVLNPETIYFKVAADQTEVTRMVVDQSVVIMLDSFIDTEIKGKITKIDYAPDPGEIGVIYGIKVALEPSNVEYRLGMTGDAEFMLSEAKDVLYVPIKFVQSDKEGKYVFLNKSSNKVYIEIGIEGEERVEIKGDIKEGDTVYD